MIRRISLSYLLTLHLLDLLVVLLALTLSYTLRTQLNVGAVAGDTAFETPPWLYVLASAVWVLAFQLFGVYLPRNVSWLWRELQRLIVGHGFACLLFFGVLYLTYRDYSRLQALYVIIIILVGALGYRLLLRALFKILGRRPVRQRLVIIVGVDPNAQRVGRVVSVYTWTGLNLLGYLKHHPQDEVVEELSDQILGASSDSLPELVEKHKIDEVIIVLKSPDYAYVGRVIDSLRNQVTNIRLAPDYSDLAYFHVSVENFGGVPLIGLREAVLSPTQRAVKRTFDVCVSGAALLVGWPLLAIIALAIKLESPGSVIFTQERIGEYGKRFKMFKFRSMVVNAEKLQDKSVVDHKRADDPRITRVGHLLRRTSLDELPQLINILRGDMSIVGPRPEMPWLVDKYEPWQRKRFEVPQGLTGWWQISGRADKPMYMHTEDDLFYIRNYSLWLDAQIIFRTMLIVIRGKGAY